MSNLIIQCAGTKKGAADLRLRNKLSHAMEDFRDHGLQLATVVLVSSDSDYSR